MLAERTLPTVRDRYLALHSLPALEPLEPEALLMLAEGSSFARFEAGTYMTQEGEPITEVFIVLEGRVDVRTGGRLLTDDARTVGFVSLLAQDSRGVSAYAHTKVLALSIPRDIVLDVYESNFSLLRTSLRNSARTALRAQHNLPNPSKSPSESPPTDSARPDADADPGEPPSRRLSFVEKILLNRDTPLLAGANLDAVADLAEAMEEVRVDPSTILFERGSTADFSLRIFYGRVQCIAENGESVEVGPGMVLGGLDVAAMLPRSYTARTLTPVVAFRTSSEDFFGMTERHPEVGMRLLALLSRSILESAASTDP